MMQFVMQPGMVTNTRSGGSRRYWSASQLSAQCSSNWPSIKCLSIELRRRHNDVAAAIFSVVGVTFAVLLAFVAMLAWEGFNKAKAAAYAEAATVLDVFNASVGLAGPETSQMREAIVGYLEIVVRVEWPAQAEGRIVDRGKAYPEKLNTSATGLKPSGVTDGNLHAQLLQSLARLSDARQHRLLAAETTIPAVVWIVTIVRRGAHDCLRLLPRRSEPRHASCHVGH